MAEDREGTGLLAEETEGGAMVPDTGPGGNTPTNPMDMDPKEFKRALDRRRKNRDALVAYIRDRLVSGIDFERVFSKKRQEWSKPFLTKAGSEKVLGMLGVTPTFPDLPAWETKAANGEDMQNIFLRCELVDSLGRVVGTGAGARNVKNQDYGDVNKAIKMALKSAQIDATLRLGGLSEIFSQDLDSMLAQEQAEVPTPLNPGQLEVLQGLCSELQMPEGNVARFYGVERLEDIPAEKYERVRISLAKKLARMKGEDHEGE